MLIYKNIPHWKFFLLNIFGFIYSTENIVMAYIVGSLTDMASTKRYSNMPKFFLQIIVILTLLLVSNLLFNYLKANAIGETNKKLRKEILRGMLYNEEENSDNLGFLTNDFKLLETNQYEAEISILLNIYTLILAFSYAFVLNWTLTLVFFIGALLPTVISNRFQSNIKNATNEWSKANSMYVNHTKHILQGTELFNLYNQVDKAVDVNGNKVNALENRLLKLNLLKNNADAWINIIAMGGTFILPLSVGIIMVIRGETTLGALFAIVQLTNSFVNPILQILTQRNNLATTQKIVKRINELLHKKDAIQTACTEFKELIINNLTLEREKKKLANHINITLKKGEKAVIIGPSGSGKSTLFQFLLYGKHGSAQLIKINLEGQKKGTFKDIFGYVSQKTVLFPESLLFNLTLGAKIPKERVLKVCEKLELRDLIKEKGLGYKLENNANELSGGQIARIGLARAILIDRPVLLLDEIDASLDKVTAKSIKNWLMESNLTFIEISHHYSKEDLNKYDHVINMAYYKTHPYQTISLS